MSQKYIIIIIIIIGKIFLKILSREGIWISADALFSSPANKRPWLLIMFHFSKVSDHPLQPMPLGSAPSPEPLARQCKSSCQHFLVSRLFERKLKICHWSFCYKEVKQFFFCSLLCNPLIRKIKPVTDEDMNIHTQKQVFPTMHLDLKINLINNTY